MKQTQRENMIKNKISKTQRIALVLMAMAMTITFLNTAKAQNTDSINYEITEGKIEAAQALTIQEMVRQSEIIVKNLDQKVDEAGYSSQEYSDDNEQESNLKAPVARYELASSLLKDLKKIRALFEQEKPIDIDAAYNRASKIFKEIKNLN